jgi:hypothetical protein
MTDDEVRREILQTIAECEVEGPRGDLQPAVDTIWRAKEIRNAVFKSLKDRGMLRLDPSD